MTMNSMMVMNMQTKRMAGIAAALGTFLTVGGTLTLAEHYARTSVHAREYVTCNSATDSVAPAGSRQAANA
jgi:hypothetical protein